MDPKKNTDKKKSKTEIKKIREIIEPVVYKKSPGRRNNNPNGYLPNLIKFKPGVSGNPKGRPKKKYTVTDAINDIIQANSFEFSLSKNGHDTQVSLKSSETLAFTVATMLVSEAMNGNMSAIKEIFDRTDGKVADRVELKTMSADITDVEIYIRELKSRIGKAQ